MSTLHSTQYIGASTSTPVGPPQAEAQFAQLAQELQALVQQPMPLAESVQRALELAARFAHTQWVAWYQFRPDGTLRPQQAYGRADVLTPDMRVDFEKLLRTSGQRGGPLGHVFDRERQLAAVSIPLRLAGHPPSALAGCGYLGPHGLSEFAVLLETIASAVGQLVLLDTLRRLEWEAQSSAAIVELLTTIQTAESYEEALHAAVNELQKFFHCQRVNLGVLKKIGIGVELAAVSGLSDFDRSSQTAQQLVAAMDELLLRGELTCWPPQPGQTRHALMGHRQLFESTRAEALVSVPLTTASNETFGVMVAEGPPGIIHAEQQLAAWQAVAPHLAAALDGRRRAEPSRLQRWCRDAFAGAAGKSRRHLAVTILGLCVLGGFMPVPYRVTTKCRVEPVTRRFVVAPYDGRLKKSFVEPGEIVAAQDVLATMDDRELRWELDSLMAERYRAAKQRDTSMADHDTSAAQMAELEVERLDAKIKLLTERQSNLEIMAPIAGVVLKGDLEDAEGAPVTIGQALFEVAPLERVKLELAIREDDIAWIQGQLKVQARLDADHQKALRGVLQKVHPRAEIRDNRNVFVAYCEIDNSDDKLRPGMQGKAWVQIGYRPLGWIWLHKGFHRLRMWTGW